MDGFSEDMMVEKAWDLLRKTQYLSDLEWDVEFPEAPERDSYQKTSAFEKKKEKPITPDEDCSSHSLQPEIAHHLVQKEASNSDETDTARHSASAMESRVSVHKPNIVVKEEADCIDIKEEFLTSPSNNISYEQHVKSEILHEDIKESAVYEMRKETSDMSYAGCSSQPDMTKPLIQRKISTSVETETRSSVSVIEGRVSIHQTNIVVKEEPDCIEVKEEPLSPVASSILCEEPVKNETHDGDIQERVLHHVVKEQESEEGGKSSVDPLPVSGREMPQVEMCPCVGAVGSGNVISVSAMKKELETNSFASSHCDASGELSPGTESDSVIAETHWPIMTQMDSTRQINRGTYTECNTASCLQIASFSSQSPSAEVMGMSSQEHSSLLLQNSHCELSSAMASSSTAAGGYLLERHGEGQVPGKGLSTHNSLKGSDGGVCIEVTLPEREMGKSPSLRRSNESVREGKGITFQCLTCENLFTSIFLLDKHKRLHSCERTFKCSQCKNSFRKSEHLTQHMRIHSGDKSFKCCQCEKSFSYSCSLIRHMRIHSGEKPFMCSQCEKSFGRSEHLTQHMRIHSGDKPFKCCQCEKSFRQSSHLINHMRIHSGEKLFKCCQCQKSFSKSSHLIRHMHIH